jgi:thermitase
MKYKLIRLSSLIMIAMLVIGLVGPVSEVNAADDTNGFVPGEIVIRLHQPADLPGVADAYDLDPAPLSQFGARPIYRLKITDGSAPPQKAAALLKDGRVMYAEPNYIGYTPEGRRQVSWAKGERSEYVGQWAISRLRIPDAHGVSTGKGVIVAVLDTGIDLDHPLFEDRLVQGYDFVSDDRDPSEERSQGDHLIYGHGTHVAGLIALAAPDAKIMPLRVLDEQGAGNIWVMAEALAYAAEHGAQVISLSLSTLRHTDLLTNIIQDVICDRDDDDDDDDDDDHMLCLGDRRGIVVVAAAGNSGSDQKEYPAAEQVKGLLAVGSSTQADQLADFSNFGSWVSVLAPGEAIYSSIPGGEYASWSGTSMSAPLAAGLAALIRAHEPELEAFKVTEQIIKTAVPVVGPVPLRIDYAQALGIPFPMLKGEYKCNGTLGYVQVDSVLVQKNHTCDLTGTRVKGNIKIEQGGKLTARFLQVDGNLQADGAASLKVLHSSLDGNIQIVKSGKVHLEGLLLDGDVQLFNNTGDIYISANDIDGNLQCKDNRYYPQGGDNIVDGNKENQCAGL